MHEKAIGIFIATFAGFFTNEFTKIYIGVDLSTVVGAVLGTAAAVGYDTTDRAHGRTYALAFSSTITACLLTGFVPKLMGWEWTAQEGAEAGVAGVAALILYYFMPPAGKRLGEIVKAFKLSDVLPRRRRDEDNNL